MSSLSEFEAGLRYHDHHSGAGLKKKTVLLVPALLLSLLLFISQLRILFRSIIFAKHALGTLPFFLHPPRGLTDCCTNLL